MKDLENEKADTIRAKVSLTLQNSKSPKDNLSKDERKALKELQSDTSIVILPADKGRSTVILNREDYLEKCMDHINNGPYQLWSMSKMKITMPRILPRFPTTSEMFPLKMMR